MGTASASLAREAGAGKSGTADAPAPTSAGEKASQPHSSSSSVQTGGNTQAGGKPAGNNGNTQRDDDQQASGTNARKASWWRNSPWWRGGPVLAALVLAFSIHKLWPVNSFIDPDPLYGWLLQGFFFIWVVLLALVPVTTRLRAWVVHYGPLLTVAVLLVLFWEVSTSKLSLLPMPYFPGPDKVFAAFNEDGELLLISALHSLRLLGIGYIAGATLGFMIGLTLGWSRVARYWGMPVLKTLGPIPAPAWIPVAMIVFPTSFQASTSLVALSSLFPMIVLTSSGITSVRQSHLDVARMLGASPRQLIWRVAIPSALPTIFVGLFQALGASFLTLIVAEMVGVKAGLGWYITWAQNYMEYYKVAAALIIMSVFFSGIMTALFQVRDRVLRWQQGLIKW